MSDDNELLPGRVLSTVESDPASPRTAESRDLRGDVDETPPIEPGHRPAPEVRERETLAAIRARSDGLDYDATRKPLDTSPPERRALWQAREDVRFLLRALAAPLPDDEVRRLRAALDDAAVWLEAEADYPRPDPRPAMRLQASLIRAALAPHPSEPPNE